MYNLIVCLFNYLVVNEGHVIVRESISHSYKLFAYYIAKQIAELAVLFLRPFIMVTILYWFVGLSGFYMYMAMIAILFLEAIYVYVLFIFSKII